MGLSLLIVTSLFSRGFNLLVLVVIARTFNAGVVGTYAMASAGGGFAFFAADLGLGQLVAREGAASPERLVTLHSATMKMRSKLALGVLLLLILWAVAREMQHKSWLLVALILVSFLLQTFAYGNECYARAESKMHVETLAVVASAITSFAVVIVGSVLLRTPIAIGAGLVAGAVCRWVVARAMVRAPRIRTSAPWELVRRGAPYSVTTLLQTAFVQLDVLIIGGVGATALAGQYALVNRPILAVGSTVAYAGNALIPGFARRATRAFAEASRSWLSMTIRASLVGTAIAASAALVGGFALPRLYGSEHAGFQTVPWLICCCYAVFAITNGVSGSILTGLGLQTIRGAAVLFGVFVTVVACLGLVPAFGLYGAAAQLVLSEAAVTVALVVAGRARIRRIQGAI